MVAGAAQTSGMVEIRGLDVDKLAKGFADEEIVLKKYVTVTSTSAREVRWYQKGTGYLDSVDTTGVAASQIETDELSLPTVIEQNWTRVTSYVKVFMAESPLLSDQDIKDSDIDIIGTNVRDIVRGVMRQEDIHIYSVLGEAAAGAPTTPVPSLTNNAAAIGTGWDDLTNGKPLKDIMIGLKNIRANGYDTGTVMMYINPVEHLNLLNYLIDVKGSSIPQFASQRVGDGVVMEILGVRVVVSQNSTTDYVPIFVPDRAVTYKQFSSISSALIKEELIGTKIRVRVEGIALLTDPKAVHWITDTVTA